MLVLVWIWFAAAIGGIVAVVASLLLSDRQRELLGVAGVLFAIAGVLGILSIGILFLGASAACFARVRGLGGSGLATS